MNDKDYWKGLLYQAYVSSGQAQAATTTPEAFFLPNAPYLIRLIRRHIPPDREIRIIDLGCGSGGCLYFLKRAGYRNVAGVDVSSEQVDQARRLGIVEAQQGELDQFLRTSLPGSVDVILLLDVLEHFQRDELFEILTRVHGVLKPDGRCIVHVPNGEGLYGMRIRYGDLTHEQAFTAKSLHQVFTVIGFRGVASYEERPHVHGFVSLFRRMLWMLGTSLHRVLLMAETGERKFILSQNLLAVAWK